MGKALTVGRLRITVQRLPLTTHWHAAFVKVPGEKYPRLGMILRRYVVTIGWQG